MLMDPHPSQQHAGLHHVVWWLGRLNSWVVSHSALIIGTLRHALGREFEPWWWHTLFWTQAQHLRFIHDSIWFIWFDTIICLSNLSCELWNRKLKIKKKLKKNILLAHLEVNCQLILGYDVVHCSSIILYSKWVSVLFYFKFENLSQRISKAEDQTRIYYELKYICYGNIYF